MEVSLLEVNDCRVCFALTGPVIEWISGRLNCGRRCSGRRLANNDAGFGDDGSPIPISGDAGADAFGEGGLGCREIGIS